MASKTTATTAQDVIFDSLKSYNEEHGVSWSLGGNYTSKGTEFEQFFLNELFPKLAASNLHEDTNGNSFNFMFQEVENIAQLTEDYVITDSRPIGLNLSRSGMSMLETHFRNIASKLYNKGVFKKSKFTVNNNEMRSKFSTLRDACVYATALYNKSISDINVMLERETKAMLVDYFLNHLNDKQKRTATSADELTSQITLAMLDMQTNSSEFNETDTASGGKGYTYTTVSDISDIVVVTSTAMKNHLLNTNIANTFQLAGLDPTERIMAFSDLGGVFKLTDDVVVDDEFLAKLKIYGDYETQLNDVIKSGSIFSYDISDVSSLKNKFVEIKPKTQYFAMVFDKRSVRLQRNTQNMLQKPFENPETGNINYWLHFLYNQNILPFYNKILIGG